ncbi:hypothetical protein Cantr_00772 [Candida viswanathii]|uniref:Uncharacterized protein n=1 Tax=Candida viswanathii TaxID=5486 RepID=A0A367YG66_9ASCO|nr:hypothetical protein Cantr_00772 [Candida viswanathii]
MPYTSSKYSPRTQRFMSAKLSKVLIGPQVPPEYGAAIDANCTHIETIELLKKMMEKYDVEPPTEIKFTRISHFQECMSKCGYLISSGAAVSVCFVCGDGFDTHQEIETFFDTQNIRTLDDVEFRDVMVHGDGVADITIELVPLSVQNLELVLVNVNSVLLTNTLDLKRLHYVANGGVDSNPEVFCNLLPNSIADLRLDLSRCEMDQIFVEFPIAVQSLVFKLNTLVCLKDFDIGYLSQLAHLTLEGVDIGSIATLRIPESLTRLFWYDCSMDTFTDFQQLKHIEELSIREVYLDGRFLSWLAKLPNLRELQYKEPRNAPKHTFKPTPPINVRAPPKLEFLEIQSKHVRLTHLYFHTTLKFLVLKDVTIEPTQLSLRDAPNLVEVLIDNTNIKKIYGFENCPHLKLLKFNGTPIYRCREIQCVEFSRKNYPRVVNNGLGPVVGSSTR